MDSIVILVGPRGRGSNMRALVTACREGIIEAVPATVIAAEPSAATEWAEEHSVAVTWVSPGDDYGARLRTAIDGAAVVCLAGYLRLLPVEVLRAHPRRVLNVHPSLLPKFGGRGMYGMRVHEAVLAAGETESGCTVHRVTEVYDEGEVVLQAKCPVLPDDTPDTLAARVLELEHETYPLAVRRVLTES